MLKCGLPGGGVKSSKIAPTRLCLLHPGDVYLYARAVTRECAKTGANRGVYGLSSMLSREPLTISLGWGVSGCRKVSYADKKNITPCAPL